MGREIVSARDYGKLGRFSISISKNIAVGLIALLEFSYVNHNTYKETRGSANYLEQT